jgi:hypothetical protein
MNPTKWILRKIEGSEQLQNLSFAYSLQLFLTILTVVPLTESSIMTGEYRNADLKSRIELSQKNYNTNPNLSNLVQLRAEVFYRDSGKDVVQSYQFSNALPIVTPFIAALPEIPQTKRFTPYWNWNPNTGKYDNEFVPIKDIDGSDIFANFVGGGISFAQLKVFEKSIESLRRLRRKNK